MTDDGWKSFHYPAKPEKPAPSSANAPPIDSPKQARDASKRKGK